MDDTERRPLRISVSLKEYTELCERFTRLQLAAQAALERLGGDARDGNLGWAKDHPVVATLREALEPLVSNAVGHF